MMLVHTTLVLSPGLLGRRHKIAIQMFEVDHRYPVKRKINGRLLIWLRIRD